MTPWITKPVPFNIGQGAAAAGGGTPAIDDTGLVALYKFDESSMSVPNSSESSDSGGTDFDATATGATTDVTGHIDGTTCFSFDGVDDNIALYDDSDLAKSIWNFLHDGTTWSCSYWIRRITIDAYVRLWDQLYDGGGTLGNGATAYFFDASIAPFGDGNFMITNNTAQRVLDATFSSAFWNDTDWHFYTHTWNITPASNNLVSTIDNATTVNANKSAFTPSANNALANMTGMSNVGGGNWNNAEIQQLTFWNVVIDQDVQDALWNDGDGRAFYT